MAWWPRRSSARDGIQDDVRDELASHVELRIKDNLRRGMTPADAGREAAARFGPVTAVAVDCERIQRRRESRARSLWLDVRAAWLGWRRSPMISVLGAVVGAVGLTTALLAALLADAMFVRQPQGMRSGAAVFTVLESRDGKHPQLISYEKTRLLAAAAPEHLFFSWQDEDFQLDSGRRSGTWTGIYVGGEYFKALGVDAAAGRLLEPGDEIARRPVVVISRTLAREFFGSSAAAAGQTLRVNGRSMLVVGVAGGGFRGGASTMRADVWLPVTIEALLAVPRIFPSGRRVQGFVDQPDIGWLHGGVRLTAPAARTSAQDRFTAAIRAVPRIGATAAGEDLRVAMLFDRVWLSPFTSERDRLTAIMKPIGLAVSLTLLLAAACVSSLLVGRLVQRQHEFAVRLALGASRWRLLRIVIVEHAIAIAAAAALAVPAAIVLLRAIERLQIVTNVRVTNIAVALDGRAMMTLLALTFVLGVVSLIGPLAFARASASAMSVGSSRMVSSGTRLRRGLMAAQVAVGCALLAAGGLLTKTIDELRSQPLGYDAAHVAFADVDLAKAGLDESARGAAMSRLRARAQAPGASVALATEVPFAGSEAMHLDVPESGRSPDSVVNVTRIDGPYFETLGIRVVAGRGFTGASAARREAIVSEPFAEYFWKDQNAIGRTMRVGGRKGELHEVVGIVAGIRDVSMRLGPMPRMYLPIDGDANRVVVVARQAGPGAAASELAALIGQADDRLSPARAGVLEDLALQSIEQRRLIRWMTIVVGTGSLLMVAVGVWGLAHTSVSRRWREFGLRLALGAERREVARLALRDAVIVTTTGVAAGVLAAWQFGRALSSFLFGVAPFDPVVIATAAIVVAAAVFAGAWLPARRAARADPSQLLRTQ